MTPTEAQPGLSASLPSLWALGERGSDRLRRALTAYAITTVAGSVARRWWVRGRAEMAYTVAVPSDDDLYPPLHRWMLGQLAPRRRKALIARTGPAPAVAVEAPEVRLFYDSTRVQTVVIEGQRIRVGIDRDGMGARPSGGSVEQDVLAALSGLRERVVLTAWSTAGRDAILALLARLADEQRARLPRVYFATKWGDWSARDSLSAPPLDSVVLRRGRREALVADVGQFLAVEHEYNRLGLPWHRGYLFHGPPGTGKTSIARAIAGHFRLDVYYVALAALQNDSAFATLLHRVEPRSLLLLEDVDVVHAARVRDDTDPGVTLGGLLNALDGFVTPHGAITVMTTNRVEVLDPALTRPGRVDVSEEMGYLDDAQLHELIRVMLGSEVALQLVRDDLTPADVVEVVKDHITSAPGETLQAIERLVRTQPNTGR